MTDTTPIVNPEEVITPPAAGEVVIEPAAPPVTTPEPPAVAPGDKTEPALLLENLHIERDKRRTAEANEAEAKRQLAAALEAAAEAGGEVLSPEGKALQAEIRRLGGIVAAGERTAQLNDLHTAYPALKDKDAEFKEYLRDPENAGMSLKTAAKSFLTENNLLAPPAAPRRGLERETGGGHVPVKTGLTPDEIDNLRINNYGEYVKRLKAGTLFT